MQWHSYCARIVAGDVPAPEVGTQKDVPFRATESDVGRRGDDCTFEVVRKNIEVAAGVQSIYAIRTIAGDVEISVGVECHAVGHCAGVVQQRFGFPQRSRPGQS